MRGESGEGAAPDAATPIAQAVSQAYRVFDEYLKEGREFAAGESAWNRRSDGPGPGPVPAAQNGELLEALLWIFDQFAGGAARSRPAAALSAAPPAAWPQPRWPAVRPGAKAYADATARSGAPPSLEATQRPQGPPSPIRDASGDWEPWDFGKAAAPASEGASATVPNPKRLTR